MDAFLAMLTTVGYVYLSITCVIGLIVFGIFIVVLMRFGGK